MTTLQITDELLRSAENDANWELISAIRKAIVASAAPEAKGLPEVELVNPKLAKLLRDAVQARVRELETQLREARAAQKQEALRIRLEDATRREQDHAQWIMKLSLFLSDDEMREHHQSYKGHCVDDAIAVIRSLRTQRDAAQGALKESRSELARVTAERDQAQSDRQKEHEKRVHFQGSLDAVNERLARRTALLERTLPWRDLTTMGDLARDIDAELATDQPAEQGKDVSR